MVNIAVLPSTKRESDGRLSAFETSVSLLPLRSSSSSRLLELVSSEQRCSIEEYTHS